MKVRLVSETRKYVGLKPKLIITITNNISFDQRMSRIATSLSDKYDVLIIGTITRNPPRLQEKIYKQKRLTTIFHKGKFFYLEYNFRLFLFLLFHKFHHLYTVDLDTMIAGIAIRKIKKFRWIYDSHEYFTELPELLNKPRVKAIWNKIASIGIPNTEVRFTVNESLANELSIKYKEKFHYVRNMPFYKENEIVERKQIILYQGALNIGRGLSQMIMAMNDLPNYELQICGDGPERAKFEMLVKENNLSNVLFLGMKTPSELTKITASVYLGINLLEGESLNYHYSLANKFFDYTMALVPSLNMDFPAYRKLNEEFEVSILLPSLTSKTIIHAIKSLENNPQQYQLLKSNCKEAKELWNWEAEKTKLIELLEHKN